MDYGIPTTSSSNVLTVLQKLVEPATIQRWAIVNFSASCNINGLIRDLIKCRGMKGISINEPFEVFEENQQCRHAQAPSRVQHMFETMKSRLPGPHHSSFFAFYQSRLWSMEKKMSFREWNCDIVHCTNKG